MDCTTSVIHRVETLSMIAILVIIFYFVYRKITLKLDLNRLRRIGNRVIIFSRYPRLGFTKTRLIPWIGTYGATVSHLHMFNHILYEMFKLCESTDCVTELCCTGCSRDEVLYWLRRISKTGNNGPWLLSSLQVGINLGEKMTTAVECAFIDGCKNVVVVGSDIPAISAAIVEKVIKMLAAGECDVILGPTSDGGFYLIGISIRVFNKLVDLFHDIDWGSGEVLEQQVAVARKLNINFSVLPVTLQDVDEIENLAEIKKAMNVMTVSFAKPLISVIIPTFNEESCIENNINKIIEMAESVEALEIIVSDAESTDSTLSIVNRLITEWASNVSIKLIVGLQGRGCQQNRGVEIARGQILFFLHADTLLPKFFDREIRKMLLNPGVSLGVFKFGLDVNHLPNTSVSNLFLAQMRLVEWGTNIRSKKFESPYGDQGLFMWRNVFNKLNGFPNYPLMEDYELIRRGSRIGHIGVVDKYIITSSRRWQKHGILKTTGINWLFVLAYKLGVSPYTLARWYYKRDCRENKDNE